ncbi:hypothetical protein [Alicyclobacillus mengziensis]|uniref:Uncharacterized protein n=1 Tax=Alicyclobacillus mengziensis TaxID=2931921 RepID=A0A9X7W0E0_9BACL|nr:hypothetical protein [Alicyclobacillus mengziensis]QSO48396.1 hypothetical protein JZ786_05255 [Alicyclobacillus mengziensis]
MDYKQLTRQEALKELVLRAIGTGKLTIPLISEVTGLSNFDVAKLAVFYYNECEQETSSSSESDDEPEVKSEESHRIKLLDKPINKTRVPMAVSTERTLKELNEAIGKLREQRV